MGRVIITPRARADLDEIWSHIALDSPSAADRLIDRIVARCQGLADHPHLGPARLEIAADARGLVIGDYLTLYRVLGADAQIVRVVHGARRLRGMFDLGPDD